MGPGLRDDSAEGNVMNNTEKLAGIFGGPSAAEREQLLQQFYGKRLLSSTGAGAGIGLGAAALYHLLRGMKPEGKKEKKYPSYGSGTPMIAKEANLRYDPSRPLDMSLVGGSGIMPQNRPAQNGPFGGFNPESMRQYVPFMQSLTKIPFSSGSMYARVGQAMQAARPFETTSAANSFAPQQQMNPGINKNIVPAAPQPFGFVNGMPNNNQGPFSTANNPFAIKNSFDLNSLSESVGKALPTTMVPFGAPNVPGRGPAPSADPHPWRKSWSTAANIGGAALGTYAGAKLINSLVKAKKKRDRESALEAARAEYYNALGGKSASALDVAFDRVKQANMLSSTASALWNTPQTLRTAYLLTLLGAGGLGAKYMYDRTKNLTEGENLAKAQASRARTKGLPPVWVDPESLAHIKSTVESDE
jgi:hypothetical protein